MRLNPTVAIAHVLAIALGVWGGWTVIARVVPDFPSDNVAPGISAASEPDSVAGSDPGSLLRPEPLRAALDELGDQVAAGEGIAMLRIEPGALHADTGEGEVLDPGDVPAEAPSQIVAGAARRQPRIDLDHVREIVLVPGGKGGGTWYLQILSDDPKLPPPWTYFAPLVGSPVKAGGEVPEAAP